MAALTEDRKTAMQDGELLYLSVAASTELFAGAILAVNSAGDVVPASDTAGLKVVGRAEEYIDNSAGAAEDKYITVRRIKAFWYANSGTGTLTKAHTNGLAVIYIEDDNTVTTAAGSNSIVAGKALQVDATYGVLVWFE